MDGSITVGQEKESYSGLVLRAPVSDSALLLCLYDFAKHHTGDFFVDIWQVFAPTIMRRDQYTILRRCCREVEMRPRRSHVCRW
jgi:hypothetical protein